MIIKVNGINYDYFNDVSISTTLDAVASTFAFSGKYDPANPIHRILFQPLSFARVEFFDEERLSEPGKGLLSTGRITSHDPSSSSIPNLYNLAGYSLPGVLEDCNMPFSKYPVVSGGAGEIKVISLESNNLTLEQIINKSISNFDFKFIVYDSVREECSQIIPKSVCRPEEKIKEYICKIANQKNVVISHDIHGNLIAFRPNVKSQPRITLTKKNGISMRLSVNGQNMHSHITCIRQPEKGNGDSNPFTQEDGGGANPFEPNDGGEDHTLKISSMDTVLNPLVGVFRPRVDVLSSGTFYDTYRAAQNARAAELKSIKVMFALDHWVTMSVGDVVRVENDEIFINGFANMVLESTVISQIADSKSMSGSLVMPETFTGETPVNIFKINGNT